MMLNARQHERADFFAAVDLRPHEGDTEQRRVWGSELSENGIFLQTSDPLEPGATVALCFTVDSERVDVRQAEVVWARRLDPTRLDGRMPGMGVRFVGVESVARQTLRSYVSRTLPDVSPGRARVHPPSVWADEETLPPLTPILSDAPADHDPRLSSSLTPVVIARAERDEDNVAADKTPNNPERGPLVGWQFRREESTPTARDAWSLPQISSVANADPTPEWVAPLRMRSPERESSPTLSSTPDEFSEDGIAISITSKPAHLAPEDPGVPELSTLSILESGFYVAPAASNPPEESLLGKLRQARALGMLAAGCLALLATSIGLVALTDSDDDGTATLAMAAAEPLRGAAIPTPPAPGRESVATLEARIETAAPATKATTPNSQARATASKPQAATPKASPVTMASAKTPTQTNVPAPAAAPTGQKVEAGAEVAAGRMTLPLQGGRIVRHFTLSNPTRVVVDLVEAEYPGFRDEPVASQGIARLRVGRPDREHVRVVVELEGSLVPRDIQAVKRTDALAIHWR